MEQRAGRDQAALVQQLLRQAVGVDTDRLALALLDDGWLIAPGSLFHATRRPSGLMRINVATSQDPAFWRALDRRRTELQRRGARA